MESTQAAKTHMKLISIYYVIGLVLCKSGYQLLHDRLAARQKN
jgi:hypothetical protein